MIFQQNSHQIIQNNSSYGSSSRCLNLTCLDSTSSMSLHYCAAVQDPAKTKLPRQSCQELAAKTSLSQYPACLSSPFLCDLIDVAQAFTSDHLSHPPGRSFCCSS